jgi:hypothetical protein
MCSGVLRHDLSWRDDRVASSGWSVRISTMFSKPAADDGRDLDLQVGILLWQIDSCRRTLPFRSPGIIGSVSVSFFVCVLNDRLDLLIDSGVL